MQTLISHSTLNIGFTVERLLEELEDLYPPFNPSPDQPSNVVMYRAGQRSVVEWIKSRLIEEDS